jgi:hypothetical protein
MMAAMMTVVLLIKEEDDGDDGIPMNEILILSIEKSLVQIELQVLFILLPCSSDEHVVIIVAVVVAAAVAGRDGSPITAG